MIVIGRVRIRRIGRMNVLTRPKMNATSRNFTSSSGSNVKSRPGTISTATHSAAALIENLDDAIHARSLADAVQTRRPGEQAPAHPRGPHHVRMRPEDEPAGDVLGGRRADRRSAAGS